MKKAYHYDYETLIFVGVSEVHKIGGYDNYILPQLSTWIAPPLYDNEIEQCTFDVVNQVWLKENKPVKVVGYNKKNKTEKIFHDKSVVTDDYTIKIPLTEFDEWINGNWVTNLDDKFHFDFEQVDDTRRRLYSEMVDPLMAEASVKEVLGKQQESALLTNQAIEARKKIQSENPYPIR